MLASLKPYAQQEPLLIDAPNYKIRAVAEIGFLGVFAHKVQFSNSGTYFDYQKDGGQDVLFPIRKEPIVQVLLNQNNAHFL